MFGEWASADMVGTTSQVEWHHLEEEEEENRLQPTQKEHTHTQTETEAEAETETETQILKYKSATQNTSQATSPKRAESQ